MMTHGRSRAGRVVWFITAVMMHACVVAHGQISPRPVGTEQLPVQAVTREDALLLAEYLDATADQSIAIESLTNAAMTRMRETDWEFRRAERRRVALQEAATMTYEQRQARLLAVEVEWLTDCRAVVDETSPEQMEGWRRFEMSRVRLLTGASGRWNVRLSLDLGSVLALGGVDEDDHPELKAKLIAWERDVDVGLREWFISMATLNKLTQDRAAYEEVNAAAFRSGESLLAVMQLQARGYRSLLEAAPESGKRALRLHRMIDLPQHVSRPARRRDAVRELLAIPDLSGATQTFMNTRLDESQREIDALVEARIRTGDDLVLAARTLAEAMDQTLASQLDDDADAIVQRAVNDIVAALTAAEREAYARVPVTNTYYGENTDREWRHDSLRQRLAE